MGKKILGLFMAGMLVFTSVDLTALADENITVEAEVEDEGTVIEESSMIEDDETQSQTEDMPSEESSETEQTIGTEESGIEKIDTDEIFEVEESGVEEISTYEIFETETETEYETIMYKELQSIGEPYGKCGDNLTWKIENGTLTISGTGEMWNYELAKNMTEAPWSIYCVDNDVNIYKVSIENGVTHIGDYAFGYLGHIYGYGNGFNGMLSIPDSVTSIGDGAFFSCNFSGKLAIPDSVTSVGENAFAYCSGFSDELIIPNSVIKIGDGAFLECSGFSGRLVISDSVTNIGEDVFLECSGFKGELIIPNNVTSVGANAFAGCSGFSGKLVIPNNVINIGEGAFGECSGFSGNLIISNSMTSIESGVFNNCSNLTDVYIPKTITKIERDSFKYYYYDDNDNISCINLNLTFHCIKDSYACNWALENGFNVVEWDGVLPSDEDRTGKCGDDLTWQLQDGEEYYILTISGTGDMYDYALKNGESTAPWIKDLKSKTVVLNIENGVTSIGKYAFYGVSSFSGNLKIPKSVASIGADAFYGCTGFTDIYILDTLTEINGNPFRYFNAFAAVLKNLELTFHCIKDSFAFNWAVKNGFTVEEWDGITIDIRKGNITINGRGYAYARFKLVDNNGILQKNKKIRYSFGKDSYTAESDGEGYVQIKSEEVSTEAPINKLIKTSEIILDPNGKNERLNYRIVMDVEVQPFSYTQTWKLGVSGSVKAGAGDVGVELGLAEVEAGLGDVDLTGSHKSTVSFKQEIVGDKRNIELTQNINKEVGLNADIGPKAKAKALTKNISIKALSCSGSGTIGYGDSIGLKIENYDPGNFNQNLDIGKFVLAMSAYQNGSEFFIRLIDRMGLDVYNVADVSAGLTGKAGANIGTVSYGEKKLGTIANVEGSTTFTYITGRDEKSESLNKETKTVCSLKRDYLGTDLGNLHVLSQNTKAGYDVKVSEDYNHNLEKLTIGVETSRSKGVLFEEDTESKKLSVEFEDEDAKKLINAVNDLRDFYYGISSFIISGDDVFRQVEETDAYGTYKCSTTTITGDEYNFPIGVSLGLKIGFTLGLEGAYDLGYITESGEYENGRIIKTGETSDVSDIINQCSGSDITRFFTDPVDIVLKQAENFFAET